MDGPSFDVLSVLCQDVCGRARGHKNPQRGSVDAQGVSHRQAARRHTARGARPAIFTLVSNIDMGTSFRVDRHDAAATGCRSSEFREPGEASGKAQDDVMPVPHPPLDYYQAWSKCALRVDAWQFLRYRQAVIKDLTSAGRPWTDR